MSEIKINQTEDDAIDFSSIENEVVKETEQIKIKTKKEAEEKEGFKPDKKLWTIFGIAAAVIIVGALIITYVVPNFL